MATPERVIEITGYPIGSIPHLSTGNPRGFAPSSKKSLLLDQAELGVGTGQWGEEIIITPDNLRHACNAEVVNLTNREAAAL